MIAGTRVGKREGKAGIGSKGTVRRVSPFGWVSVDWDEGHAPRLRPRLCTQRELVELDA